MNRIILLFVAVLLATPAQADRGTAIEHLLSADEAFARQRPREAWVELLNATDADPHYGLAWVYRARVALRLRQGHAATVALDRAVEAGYPAAKTLHFRAHALLLEGDARGALEAARADRVPAAWQGYAARMRGRALAELGDIAGAARAYTLAMRLLPKDAALWGDVARFRFETGEGAAAIAASDHAWRLAPHDVPTLVMRGIFVRRQYGLQASLPWFDKAIEIDRHDIEALIERAATLGELGRMRDMLEDTRAVLSLDPENARAFYLQAVLAARARNFPLADAMLDRTAGRLDSLPAVALLRATIAIHSGDNQRAIDLLGDLVARQPDNARARRLLAAAQWRAGDAAAVVATLSPVADSADADSYVLTLLGRAFEAQGDRLAASRFLDQVDSFDARTDGAPLLATETSSEAQRKSDEVRALLAAGQTDTALTLAWSLASAHSGTADARMLLGDVLMRAGRTADAVEAYRSASDLAFSEPIAIRLVEALVRGGNPAAAEKVLLLFRHQNPMSIAGQRVHADLLMAKGEYQAATRLLASLSARLGERDAAILTNLAWGAFRAGERDAAVRSAKKAYALAPANPAIAHAYGWILLKSGGQRAGAVALLRQAAEQAPNWAMARDHLEEASRRS